MNTARSASLERRPTRFVLLVGLGLVLLLWLSRMVRAAGPLLATRALTPGAPQIDQELNEAFSGARWGQFLFHWYDWPWKDLLSSAFLGTTFPSTFFWLLSAGIAFFLLLRLKRWQTWEHAVIGALADDLHSASPAECQPRNWPWLVAGLGVVCVAFGILQSLDRFYFVQDDVLVAELPGVLQGCRSMANGEFPDWNPYQLMGAPLAGEGLYSLLYPPTFICYAAARWGLANENATLDLFALVHLLAGVCATSAAARSLGMRPALAFGCAISYVLSGYVLIIGRSWHCVLPIVVWMPLLAWSWQAWMQGRRDSRWLWGASLAIAGLYYVGFAQYWFYGMFFLAVAALAAWRLGTVNWRQMLQLSAAGLLGLAMILPLLCVQLRLTRGMEEQVGTEGQGIANGLLATMLPYPLSNAPSFMRFNDHLDPGPETARFFAGPIFMAGGYLGLVALVAFRWRRSWLAQHPWLPSAIAALWLGLGPEGRLWPIFGQLPIVSSVNHHPHRLLVFFTLFTLLTGGAMIERLLRRGPSPAWEYSIAGLVVAISLYHVSLCHSSLWSYGDRPYPPMAAGLSEILRPDDPTCPSRVYYLGPFRSYLPHFVEALPLPLATASVYGVYSAEGYDPILQARPEHLKMSINLGYRPLEVLRACGVRWVMVARMPYFRDEQIGWSKVEGAFLWPSPQQLTALEAVEKSATPRWRAESFTVYELDDVSPLAFDAAHPQEALPIRFHGAGADVTMPEVKLSDVKSPDDGTRTLVVNVAARPWIKAYHNGQPLIVAADTWDRLTVNVPAGIQTVQIRLDLGWSRGLLCGTALGLTVFAAWHFCMRRAAAYRSSSVCNRA